MTALLKQAKQQVEPIFVQDSRMILKNPKTGLVLFGIRGEANTPGVTGSFEFAGGGKELNEDSINCTIRENSEEITQKKIITRKHHICTLPETSLVRYPYSEKGGNGREIVWECFAYGGPVALKSMEDTFDAITWETFEEGIQHVAPQKKAAYRHAYQMCKRIGFLE